MGKSIKKPQSLFQQFRKSGSLLDEVYRVVTQRDKNPLLQYFLRQKLAWPKVLAVILMSAGANVLLFGGISRFVVRALAGGGEENTLMFAIFASLCYYAWIFLLQMVLAANELRSALADGTLEVFMLTPYPERKFLWAMVLPNSAYSWIALLSFEAVKFATIPLFLPFSKTAFLCQILGVAMAAGAFFCGVFVAVAAFRASFRHRTPAYSLVLSCLYVLLGLIQALSVAIVLPSMGCLVVAGFAMGHVPVFISALLTIFGVFVAAATLNYWIVPREFDKLVPAYRNFINVLAFTGDPVSIRRPGESGVFWRGKSGKIVRPTFRKTKMFAWKKKNRKSYDKKDKL